MPINREHVTLWLDGKEPETFLERFEVQHHAAELARAHLDKTQDTQRRTWRGDIKHSLYLLIHPLGIHEWVKLLVFDVTNDRIIDPGRGRVVCRNCRPPQGH